jgi:hypothetical protein
LSSVTGDKEYAFSASEDAAVWWRSLAVEQFSTASGQSLSVGSRINVQQEKYPEALVWSADAGTVLYGSGLMWARIAMKPGTGSADPVWQDIEALVAQERDALWARNGKAVRRIPADPREGELTFSAPNQWEVRSDYARVGNYDTRPVFFPITSTGMEFTRALVPVFDGERAHLEYFEALAGTEFVDVTGGLLHARKGDEHYFWTLGP